MSHSAKRLINDVFAFMTAQYAGGPARRVQAVAGDGGVSARTVHGGPPGAERRTFTTMTLTDR